MIDLIAKAKRYFMKKFVFPLIYGTKHGYDAAAYWRDRHAKYGFSLKGSGDEGWSEDKNFRQYMKDRNRFLQILFHEGIDLNRKSVLDVGCGAGWYAGICQDEGAARYVGVDITDVLFGDIRSRYKIAELFKADCTEPLSTDERFDIILCIDVLIHVTEESRLQSALVNIHKHLKPGGVAVIGQLQPRRMKHWFYNNDWTPSDIADGLPGYSMNLHDFKGGKVAILRGVRELVER